jgi:hypothetical protein
MKSTTIGRVPLVIECGHCHGAEFLWVETEPGQAPQFCFRNFPAAGRIALAKETVVLACKECAKDIPSFIREFQEVLQ